MSTSPTLTKKQLRELEAELRSERTRLERTLTSADAEDTGNSVAYVTEPAAYAPVSSDAAMGLMLETRTHARYQSILAALTRIESAVYGSCAACTQPIPYGRLLVMPEATHCLRCGTH